MIALYSVFILLLYWGPLYGLVILRPIVINNRDLGLMQDGIHFKLNLSAEPEAEPYRRENSRPIHTDISNRPILSTRLNV